MIKNIFHIKYNSKTLTITSIIIILIGFISYAFFHDKYGYDAYVRIDTHVLPIPQIIPSAPQNISFANIIVNDFTYFNKSISKDVQITVNEKTYNVVAFSATELPRTSRSLKQPHIIVITLNPQALAYLKSAPNKTLTYHYSDGTEITRIIQ